MLKHEEWLLYAEQDLKAAQILCNSHYPVIGPTLYHAQQCAEKALKAFLVYQQIYPSKTHDLVALVERCILIDDEFKTLLRAAAELNPYVSGARYPDTHFCMPDLSVAQASINEAQSILDFIKSKI